MLTPTYDACYMHEYIDESDNPFYFTVYRVAKCTIEANASLSRKFDPASEQFVSVEWRNMAVGDIIKIISRETVPADVLVLGVVERPGVNPRGICYVETKSLDGETNLKQRSAVSTTYAKVNLFSSLLVYARGFLYLYFRS